MRLAVNFLTASLLLNMSVAYILKTAGIGIYSAGIVFVIALLGGLLVMISKEVDPFPVCMSLVALATMLLPLIAPADSTMVVAFASSFITPSVLLIALTGEESSMIGRQSFKQGKRAGYDEIVKGKSVDGTEGHRSSAILAMYRKHKPTTLSAAYAVCNMIHMDDDRGLCKELYEEFVLNRARDNSKTRADRKSSRVRPRQPIAGGGF